MSEDTTETAPEEKKKRSKKPLGCLLFLIIIAAAGYGFYELVGKGMLLQRETDRILTQARSFIELRKFDYAEATIEELKELNPDNYEVEKLEDELVRVKLINNREKELSASLQSKDWDRVQEAIINLRQRDPSHPQIAIALEEMKTGKHQGTLIALQDSLSIAQKENNLEQQIDLTKKLIRHDPENPIAARWKEINQRAQDEISESEKKARLTYEQALLVDKGVYSSELYSLAKKAKLLSSRLVYQDFYEKVSKYPRVIRYPNEYSNLQDAINAARPIDTIQISEGAFHAPVQIDKEIYMVGQGGQPSILHAAGKNAPVIYVTKNGKLTAKNISIKHVDEGEGESAYSAVTVEGEANFESCVVYLSVGHGVHVTNEGKFIAKSCRIEGNRWSGVVASGRKSLASLSDCIITRNGHNGIDAWEGGVIELYNSKSEGNKQSGAVSTTRGALKIMNSDLRNNDHAGLYITEGGKATMESSELTNNKLAGGFGDASGAVSLSKVKVIRNSVAGVVLTTGTQWEGVDDSEFSGNDGQNVWKDAEFRISEILKSIKPGEEGTETPSGESATEETASTSEPSAAATEEGTEPERAIIIEDSEE